jgi:hypothetical protein
VKKRKEIKIVNESEVNYTFIDKGFTDINNESYGNDVNKKYSNSEKDIIKTRSIDAKKSKIRYKNRITGGQNQQGHSSVYE